ncbi:energy-coupling factor transporter transmembrane protein EcfT [Vallitalea longa]|uniref:Energy-coupling factor transporter transmembrane protein EcfT n=1 Tax=Vallitalea longa TaxID=2936439 RepID=A0A9W5YE50_9FIRM|nr:energy-coupling factor transporter transmembrane component T [Vallitalea longa]GKX31011.1 energy-coupling factor transporter transmembrane protein EcfT [Vallitalea longa]
MTLSRDVDPRTKLFIVVCMSSLSVIIRDVKLLFIIFVISIIVCIMFKSPLLIVLRRLKKFILIFLFMILIQSVFTNSGTPIIIFLDIPLLTDVGIDKAFQFAFRMIIILISASLLMTSSSRELLQGLVQIKIPYDIAFMVMIGIKFIPLLSEELKDNLTAIELRGININKLSIKKKIRVYTYIFTPVIVGAVIKSKQIAIAMECKGLRAFDKRTSYIKLKLNFADYFIMILSTAITSYIYYIYL